MFWSRLTVIYVSTMLNEFYRVAFRKKVSFGKTPMQIFLDAMPMTKEKMIAAQSTSDTKTRPLNGINVRSSSG